MNKLLSANFFRLRKNKCFRGSLAFMFVIGIASPLLRYRDMKQSGYINNLDNGFFMCALFIGIILAVFCSLFIGTEHNDRTIRNKIIVGQKRETIYLSNMITCSVIAITMCIVFFVPYLSVGIPLLVFYCWCEIDYAHRRNRPCFINYICFTFHTYNNALSK